MNEISHKYLVLIHPGLHDDTIFINSFNDNCIIHVDENIDISNVYSVINDTIDKGYVIDRLAFIYHYDGPNPLDFFNQDIYTENNVEKNILEISGIYEYPLSIDITSLDVNKTNLDFGSFIIDSSFIDNSGNISGKGVINVDISSNNYDLSQNSYNVDFVYHEKIEITEYKKVENTYIFMNNNIINIINTLKSKLDKKLIVDILTCNLKSPEIIKEISQIQNDLDINIQYSLDQTGNNPRGNWILESDNVDIKNVYFTEKINEWNSILVANYYHVKGNTKGTFTYSFDGRRRHRNLDTTDYIFINNNNTSSFDTRWVQVHRDDSGTSTYTYTEIDLSEQNKYLSSVQRAEGYNNTEVDAYVGRSSGLNYVTPKYVKFKNITFSSASSRINSSLISYGLLHYRCSHIFSITRTLRYSNYKIHIYNVMFDHYLSNTLRYLDIHEGESADIQFDNNNIKFANNYSALTPLQSYGMNRLGTKLKNNNKDIGTGLTYINAINVNYTYTDSTLGQNSLFSSINLVTNSSSKYNKYTFTLDKDIKGKSSTNKTLSSINNSINVTSQIYNSPNNISIRLTHDYTPPTNVSVNFDQKPFIDLNFVVRPILSSSSITITGVNYIHNTENRTYTITVPFTNINCSDIPNAVSVENCKIYYGSTELTCDTTNNYFIITIDMEFVIDLEIRHPNYDYEKYPNGGGSEIIQTKSIYELDTSSTYNTNLKTNTNNYIEYDIDNKTFKLLNNCNISDLNLDNNTLKLLESETFDGQGFYIDFEGLSLYGLFTLEQGITSDLSKNVFNKGNVPVIKNLTIKNGIIQSNSGAFIKRDELSSVIIDNCVSDCTMSTGGTRMSGFIGFGFGSTTTSASYYLRITNCINKTNITRAHSGGILSVDSPDLNGDAIVYCEGCINYGTCTTETNVLKGSIAGSGCRIQIVNNGSITIKNCINYGVSNFPLIGSYSGNYTIENCANYTFNSIVSSALAGTVITPKNNYHTGITNKNISGFSYDPKITDHPVLDYFKYETSQDISYPINNSSNTITINRGIKVNNIFNINVSNISISNNIPEGHQLKNDLANIEFIITISDSVNDRVIISDQNIQSSNTISNSHYELSINDRDTDTSDIYFNIIGNTIDTNTIKTINIGVRDKNTNILAFYNIKTIFVNIENAELSLDIFIDSNTTLTDIIDNQNYFNDIIINKGNNLLQLERNINYRNLLSGSSITEAKYNNNLALLLPNNTIFDGCYNYIDLDNIETHGLFTSYNGMNHNNNIIIKNLKIINAKLTQDKSILVASNSDNITLENCVIQGNDITVQGSAFFGINCNNCKLINCYSKFNSIKNDFHPISKSILNSDTKNYYSYITKKTSGASHGDINNKGYIFYEKDSNGVDLNNRKGEIIII
jgi:hypothetical protein